MSDLAVGRVEVELRRRRAVRVRSFGKVVSGFRGPGTRAAPGRRPRPPSRRASVSSKEPKKKALSFTIGPPRKALGSTGRTASCCAGRERIARGQTVRPVVGRRPPVEVVSARARDDVDDGAGGLAVLGRVRARKNLVFRDRVGGVVAAAVAERVLVVAHSVDQEGVAGCRSCRRPRSCVPSVTLGLMPGARNARLSKLRSGSGKLVDLPPRDRRADRALRRLDDRRVGLHGHRLRDPATLSAKSSVACWPISSCTPDRTSVAKPGEPTRELVRPDRQLHEPVEPGRVRRRRPRQRRRRVARRHRRARTAAAPTRPRPCPTPFRPRPARAPPTPGEMPRPRRPTPTSPMDS